MEHPDYAEMPFEELLARFEPLLRRLARAYHKVFPCHDREDYYQVASIGLWEAQKRLRKGPSRHPPERFPGLAKLMAKAEIQHWLGKTNFLIRLPADVIRGRREGVDVHKMRQETQPLRLEGPAPVLERYPRAISLTELVQAPEVDLDLQMDLRTAMARMRDDFRVVLTARAKGFKPKEVAVMMGMRTAAVYCRTS